jgi:hypothetical protein
VLVRARLADGGVACLVDRAAWRAVDVEKLL